jgi:hypothetical protein
MTTTLTISGAGAHAAAAATDRIPASKSPFDATGRGYLTPVTIAAYLNLVLSGTDTVHLRRGTNAQVLQGYRTFTDTSNYERWALQSGSGYFELAVETAGTGTDDMDLRLTPANSGKIIASNIISGPGGGNTARLLLNSQAAGGHIDFGQDNVAAVFWRVAGTTGHFLAGTDNTYDIGASGATRPRTGYFATSVIIGASTTQTAPTAASLQLGAADVDLNANIVAQQMRTQGALTGGTSNQAGKDWTFIASPGKGTGAGGSFIFQVAPAGSTGSTPNTPVTALTLASTLFATFGGSVSRGNVVTKTGDFSLAATENWVICNKGSDTQVTLPAASAFPGREIYMKTIQAQTVTSVSSNVVPNTTATAGTAILPGTDGAWCIMVSDGTNWIRMASSTIA